MKTRTISPDFFGDEDLRALSLSARYLLLAMMVRADDRGCVTDSSDTLQIFAFGRERQDVDGLLLELGGNGFIKLFMPAGHRHPAYAIRDFMTQQSYHRVVVSVPMPADADEADAVLAYVGWDDFIRRAPNTKVTGAIRKGNAFPELTTLRPVAQASTPVEKDPVPKVQGAKAAKPQLPVGMYDRIATLWNEICGAEGVSLAHVLKLSDARKKSIQTLSRKWPALKHEQAWAWHFLRIACTKKLVTGWANSSAKDSPLWRPDFEFAIRESSFIKLHEGTYGPAAVAPEKLNHYGLKALVGKVYLKELEDAESATWNIG